MDRYARRRQEPSLRESLRAFPCLVLTGPRQSGKTTLVRHLLSATHAYVSLDEPDIRLRAASDPRLFLAQHPAPLILDEIQNAPALLPYLKAAIDRHRDRPGQYVLTGSQVFPLMQGVSESLAGRAAIHTLLPLSWGERLGVRASPAQDALPHVGPRMISADEIATRSIRGSYPEPALNPRVPLSMWYGSYLQTYLERDVRQVRQVGDLEEFQRFLRALAARHGQLLNMAELGRDLGVSLNTVKAWVSVMLATHQVVLVRAYHRNQGKRLVKSPRVYFIDSGMVCHLTGILTPAQWLRGPMAGALFEGEVIGELLRWHYNRGELPALYTWRTSAGQEVDVIYEHGGKPWPVEAKLGATLHPGQARGLQQFRALFPESGEGALVYAGSESFALAEGVRACPFAALTCL